MGLTLGGYLIEQDACFARNPDYIFRKIVDEYILVPIHQDVADMECIYTLNEVGAFIWDCLSEPTKSNEIAELIADNFEVETDEAREDVEDFIEQMIDIGAVKRV